MESPQSRLLDTQYILEYEPSPALVGEFCLHQLCILSWVVTDPDLCWCDTDEDALCKPLHTQDGYCKSLVGQDRLSKPTVRAVAAEPSISQPFHAPRQQLQAHGITPALQLTVQGVLRSSLFPGGPHQCTGGVSAPVPKQKAVHSGSHATAPESRAIDQLVLQPSAWLSKGSYQRLSDSESAADPAHQHHIQQSGRACSESQQRHEHAVCHQPKSATVWQGCSSGKLLDNDRLLAGGAAVHLPNLHLHIQHEQQEPLTLQYQPGICNQQQVAADRSERKQTTGSIASNSNGSQKRGRWRNRNYKRDGVLDLWSRAGLPLHAMQQNNS